MNPTIELANSFEKYIIMSQQTKSDGTEFKPLSRSSNIEVLQDEDQEFERQ